MDLMEAMKNRHSVRSYTDKKISEEDVATLSQCIAECNKESGLNIQLVTEEPKAFDSMMAHYGKFSNVSNYIALVGEKGIDLEEKCGYYGEKLVLLAQQIGLNTCWVAMTYSKGKAACKLKKGEKLCIVISIGYGTTEGIVHKSKSVEEVTKVNENMPEWFRKGVQAALLAPTAMNQQKFTFVLDGDKVTAKAGLAFYSKVDLGIVKYHFEVGADKKVFSL